MKRFPLILLTAGLLYQTSLWAEETSECVHTNRFSLRHIESKGIGYNQGYTTLEAFFIPTSSLKGRWIPFMDGRAHIFNNGKPAANVGVGLRYLNARLWGANIYYDFRKTHKLNYSQVSCGLETIGEKIDARINGYFPVGKQTSTVGSTAFDYFQGNHMYIVKKEEFALQGVNAELGIHLGRSKKITYYTAFGPYYFLNNSKQALGGSLRACLDIRESFKLEVNTSYDTLYKWIGQGQVSLAYAFKPKKFERLRTSKKKTSPSFDIRSRILQKVDKFEIIVTGIKKHKSLAINPATGQPYFFLFLDSKNLDNGAGTFEDPLNSINQIPDLTLLTSATPSTSEMPLTQVDSAPALQKTEEILPLPVQEQIPIKPEEFILLPSYDDSIQNEFILLPSYTPPPEQAQQEFIFVSPPYEPVDLPKQQTLTPTTLLPELPPALTPFIPPQIKEIHLVPGKGQELQTTLGTVMVPASQKGHPKITHVKDIEYQGKKTHVFVITMEEDEPYLPSNP